MNIRIFIFCVLTGLLLSTNICASEVGARGNARDNQNLLFSLAGSNTIGAALAPAWAEAYLRSKGARFISVDALAKENEYRVWGTLADKEVYIEIRAHGSSTGFVELSRGTADIAMASRAIKAEEQVALQHLGDLSAFETEHVVALDGLAIIVHPSNPIHAISLERLMDIFSGKITNWSELGGQDQPISVYARDEKSGTWDSFKQMILGERHQLSKRAYRFESSDQLSGSVASDIGAVGFVGLASVGGSKPLAIIDGAAEALAPHSLNVATEDYPLARRLYLYASATQRNPTVQDFLLFTLSEEGQRTVAQVGYVTQNPMQLNTEAVAGPTYYREMVKHAQRVSVNFRFHPSSAELDNKAQRDALRLANHLKQPSNQNLKVQLIGFSDHNKNSEFATVLSKLRANRVRSALFQHGVVTESVAGFGASRPLAETQDQAKLRNDRVEVWVYPVENAAAIEKMKEEAAIAETPSKTDRSGLASEGSNDQPGKLSR